MKKALGFLLIAGMTVLGCDTDAARDDSSVIEPLPRDGASLDKDGAVLVYNLGILGRPELEIAFNDNKSAWIPYRANFQDSAYGKKILCIELDCENNCRYGCALPCQKDSYIYFSTGNVVHISRSDGEIHYFDRVHEIDGVEIAGVQRLYKNKKTGHIHIYKGHNS